MILLEMPEGTVKTVRKVMPDPPRLTTVLFHDGIGERRAVSTIKHPLSNPPKTRKLSSPNDLGEMKEVLDCDLFFERSASISVLYALGFVDAEGLFGIAANYLHYDGTDESLPKGYTHGTFRLFEERLLAGGSPEGHAYHDAMDQRKLVRNGLLDDDLRSRILLL